MAERLTPQPSENDPQALFNEAMHAVTPDMPGAAAPTAYETHADPAKDIAAGAEFVTRQGLGDEAERYLRAQQAAKWAEHYENPMGDHNPTQHPDADKEELTPLAFHMSKAIGPEERDKVIRTYTEAPDKLKFPPELPPELR